MRITDLLNDLIDGRSLSMDTSRELFEQVMSGNATSSANCRHPDRASSQGRNGGGNRGRRTCDAGAGYQGRRGAPASDRYLRHGRVRVQGVQRVYRRGFRRCSGRRQSRQARQPQNDEQLRQRRRVGSRRCHAGTDARADRSLRYGSWRRLHVCPASPQRDAARRPRASGTGCAYDDERTRPNGPIRPAQNAR